MAKVRVFGLAENEIPGQSREFEKMNRNQPR